MIHETLNLTCVAVLKTVYNNKLLTKQQQKIRGYLFTSRDTMTAMIKGVL